MDFSDLVRSRQSVRRYSARPVEKDKLEKCLEAARLAPSASNSQPWTFIVVDDPVLKDRVARSTWDGVVSFNRFTLEAPVFMVIVLEKPKIITQIGARIKKREFPLIDIGIAAEHLCLQATELGLGTCMLGWFNEKTVKKLLSIPDNKSVGLIISLGYPPEDYTQKNKIRKGLQEIVRWNSYKDPQD